MKLNIDGRSYEVEVAQDAVVVDGVTYRTSICRDGGETTIKVAGRPYKVKRNDDGTLLVDGRPFRVELSGSQPVRRAAPARPMTVRAIKAPPCGGENGVVRALMPGTVMSLRVREGEQVASGAVLLVLEAMKMQNEIKAPHGGLVKRIEVTPGQTVGRGEMMVLIE